MKTQNELALEVEVQKGRAYQGAWDQLVEPFFEAKKAELYEAFIKLPTSNGEELLNIKMQVNVLDSMKDHFQHYINTGKMPQTTLEGESNEH